MNLAAARELAVAQRLLHQQLQQSYERVNNFSAMAAHDLKGPLQNISSLLNILEEDNGHEITGEGIEVLRLARKSAMKLFGIIAGLLDHAKAKSASVNLEPIDLAKAVDSVRDDLSITIDQNKGSIDLVGQVETIEADPLLFHQLLGNLIGNAFKYCSLDRAPEMQISCAKVSSTIIEMRFQDNGVGFDSKHKKPYWSRSSDWIQHPRLKVVVQVWPHARLYASCMVGQFNVKGGKIQAPRSLFTWILRIMPYWPDQMEMHWHGRASSRCRRQ